MFFVNYLFFHKLTSSFIKEEVVCVCSKEGNKPCRIRQTNKQKKMHRDLFLVSGVSVKCKKLHSYSQVKTLICEYLKVNKTHFSVISHECNNVVLSAV